MPSVPGVNHLRAIRAFEKVGFCVVRETGHTVMSNGSVRISIPRHNPVNAFTMGRIIVQAGLTAAEFRGLL